MSARRDPIERVLDLLAYTPVSAATCASRAVPMAVNRAQTHVRLLSAAIALPMATRVTDRLGMPDAGSPAMPPAGDGAAVDVAVPAPDLGSDAAATLPIEGYAHLSAQHVIGRLDGLTPDELDAVREFESRHRRRRTVLGRIDQLQS